MSNRKPDDNTNTNTNATATTNFVNNIEIEIRKNQSTSSGLTGGRIKKIQTRKQKKKVNCMKNTKKYKRNKKGGSEPDTMSNNFVNKLEAGTRSKKKVYFNTQLENSRNTEKMNRMEKGLRPVELPNDNPPLTKIPQLDKDRYYPKGSVIYTNKSGRK